MNTREMEAWELESLNGRRKVSCPNRRYSPAKGYTLMLTGVVLMTLPRLLTEPLPLWRAIASAALLCFIGGILWGLSGFYTTKRLALTLHNGSIDHSFLPRYAGMTLIFYLIAFSLLYWGEAIGIALGSTLGATGGTWVGNLFVVMRVSRLWRSSKE